MAFSDRLVHRLVIERAAAGSDDSYGQPTRTYAAHATFWGYVEPKKATEVALLSQAGPVVSDHTIYLEASDVRAADYIRFEPDDGRRFELTGIRHFAIPGHEHLECDARVVGAVS